MTDNAPSPGNLGAAEWGSVDLFSITLGVGIVIFFLLINKKHRDTQKIIVLLASGISLGPLLLILLDPLAQFLSYGSLLAPVLAEGRATLWWAAAVATLYVLRDLF